MTGHPQRLDSFTRRSANLAILEPGGDREMRVQRVIDQATETVVYARQLNGLRADREAFPNADEFFRAGFGGGGGNHLIEVKGPFVERVLPPRQSDQTWQELATELDLHDALRGAVLDILFGEDPEGRLYVHQERALRSMLQPGTSPGLILAISTATGKTESFLIPLLQKLLAPPRAATPLRAVVIYPTKTLEADQLNRVLRFVHAINRRLPAGVRSPGPCGSTMILIIVHFSGFALILSSSGREPTHCRESAETPR